MNKKGQVEDQVDFGIAIVILFFVLIVSVPIINAKNTERDVVIRSSDGGILIDEFLIYFLNYEVEGEKISSKIIEYCAGDDVNFVDSFDRRVHFSKILEFLNEEPDPFATFSTLELAIGVDCPGKSLRIYETTFAEKDKGEFVKFINDLAVVNLPSYDNEDIVVSLRSHAEYGGAV